MAPEPPLRPRLAARTTRLSVRPLAPRDFEAWRRVHAEHPPVESPFDPGPKPASELHRDEYRKILRRNERLRRTDTLYSVGLFDTAEQTLFGTASVQIVARIHLQLAWIGWRVFAQHRRRGYAREGVDALIRMAFRELALHRLEAGIEPANRISIALARSLGLRKEGSQKRSLYVRGGWTDLDVYATDAEDWGVRMVPAFGMDLSVPRRVEAVGW